MERYSHTIDQRYVVYNDPDEVMNLDQNVWRASRRSIMSGASGRHLYEFDPRHPAYYACSEGRDLQTHYIIGVDRDDHPDHSSRFGYARCPNGYCSGHWPGRYNTSLACSAYDPQPPDAAPARFYTAEYQGPYHDESQATVDYDNWKNYR